VGQVGLKQGETLPEALLEAFRERSGPSGFLLERR
jgi:hypothetical protein